MPGTPSQGDKALNRSVGERAIEEIGHTKHRRVGKKVIPIEPGALYPDNAEHISPLPVGRFSTGTIPAKFLQQNVFGRVHRDFQARTDEHRHAPIQLLLVERRAAGDEEIHLQLRGLMDQIRAAALANGSPKRTLVQVEVLFERRDECGNVRFVESDDKIDVDGRSRFPRK